MAYRKVSIRKDETNVSLFPFLAVLICTMGSLIVLLVMVVEKAKVHAKSVVDDQQIQVERQQQILQARKQERDDHLWRRDILQQQRDQIRQQVAAKRLELSHLEDHIEQIQRRVQMLQSQAKMLAANETPLDSEQELLEAEIARALRQKEEALKRLAAAKEAAAKRKPSFAIIPYDGPNGTKRRPIYIECTKDAIVLHPEGIRLTAADFEGPLGPGNPLDAALRAVRDYLQQVGQIDVNGEPYPLLLVRPDGAYSYSAARSAMLSWDDEFGYELIDDELQLAFPEPDPNLQLTLQRRVSDARKRQAILAAAMPSQFTGGSSSGLGSSQNGFGPSAEYQRELAALGFGNGGTDGSYNGEISGGYSGDSPGPYGPAAGSNSPLRANPFTASNASTAGQTPSANRANEFFHATEHTGGGTHGSGSGQNGASRAQQYSPSVAQNAGNQGSEQGSSPRASQGSSTNRSAGQTANAGGPSAGGAQGSGASQGTPGQIGGMSSSPACSLAKKRGRNWAVPNATPGATGITRPVRVICEQDRITIMPEHGSNLLPHVIDMKGATSQHVDQLVGEIWKQVKRWGLPMVSGYWKPVISVTVAPSGGQRYEELKILLDDSGMDVKRK